MPIRTPRTARCPSDGDQHRWRLTVSDAGVGLPAGFEPGKGNSVGMRVITALVGRLNAGLTFTSSAEGTAFEISRD
jgi:two-component sensor histidine kinase